MHIDRLDTQAAFDLLARPEHQRLLYGALKAAHVTRYHPQFEDCVTVAQLTWLAAYQNFEPALPANLPDFRRYAFRRIKWRTFDYLRKQTLRTQSQTDLQAAGQITIDPMQAQEAHWQLNDLITELMRVCRPGERIVLTELFLEERSVTTIMQAHGVSRRTVYNWRASLLAKAHALYQQEH
ncbi:sigma-70 family RNA polymerase sigma factor [Lactiplantibacillus garii]|uniref:Sigma-70 family RNA polymerase sigma factor n=1 Tax=Lactiplantibacillus garii TaxID=2306423 RepID=A0A3R8KCX7_9LACO|nr:sigma-70 family RNA polymerase sigma factor [Lactiplantibacillus garii]RRK09484.1 sigma-70 family RNA polymerase sigma factor [Lactiplantibacillus garii]